jgi:prepilin-type N-terminal cleavage/methylation domain-containing protein
VRGFTLTELIVTLAVIAILAGVAAPRFFAVQPVRAEAGARRLQADLRYAQRLAAASHLPCGVAVTGAGEYTVLQGGSPAVDPLTRVPMVVALEDGVTVGPPGAAVTFDPRGRPDGAASFTVGGKVVSVEPETGAAVRP